MAAASAFRRAWCVSIQRWPRPTGNKKGLPTMNPWFAKAVILLASIVMVVIRASHGQRSRAIPVVRSRKGPLEIVLLTIAWVAFFLLLLWVATPVFAWADYPLHPVPLLTGAVCLM